MRLLVISDQASFSECNPDDIDLIISCGDIEYFKLDSLRHRPKLRDIPLFAVYGNHDKDALDYLDNTVNLHLRKIEYNGLSFGGFEGSVKYKDWMHMYTQEEVEEKMRNFPYVDIFVAHSPMAGIFDIDDGVHNGFKALREYVLDKKPRFFFHGHSHIRGETMFGETKVISVFGWRVIDI